VVDIVHELKQYGTEVDIYDPWANPEEVMREYQLETLSSLNSDSYEAVILAVAHDRFKTLDIGALASHDGCVVYDIKGVLPPDSVDGRL